jgi:hypothetical protein
MNATQLVSTKRLKAVRTIFCIVAALLTSRLNAQTVTLTLPSPGGLVNEIQLPFSKLYGTPLAGQALSLQLNFADENFIRIFSQTLFTPGSGGNFFFIDLELKDNTGGYFPVSVIDGYMLDKNGNPIMPSSQLFDTGGGPGNTQIYIIPGGDLDTPTDFYGVDFEVQLPNTPSVELTDADFIVEVTGSRLANFGIGPNLPTNLVPEIACTAILLLISGIPIVVLRRLRRGLIA